MFSKVFKRFSGNKPSKSSVEQESAVDISRVIPDFQPTVPNPELVVAEETAAADTPASEQNEEVMVSSQGLPEMEEHAEAAVEALSDKHDAWARNDLDALQAAWSEVRKNANLDGHLNEVQRTAHNLTGMAKTYGHPAMARLAASLCKLIKSGQASQQHALINLHVEACRAAYFEGTRTEGADMVAQSVCVALETQVQRTLEA